MDFLITTFQTTAEWSTDVGAGSLWIAGLGRAGLRHNIPVQLCTQTPRFNFESVHHAAYTNARASDDYVTASQPFPHGNLFPVGYTSMFQSALGLSPSKDTLWSSAAQGRGHECGSQPLLGDNCASGNGRCCWHSNVALHMIVALMSRGPVGISDRIGATDVSLVLRSCSATTGRLLQPSKPLTPIDATWAAGAGKPSGEIWVAHTQVGSALLAHYVLAMGVNFSFGLHTTDLYPRPPMATPGRGFVTYGWNVSSSESRCVDGERAVASGCVVAWSGGADETIEMQTGGRLAGTDGIYPFVLLTIIPVLENGWVLLGELGKFAAVSEYRFLEVAADGDVLRLTLAGEPGEAVSVAVLCCGSLEEATVRVLNVTIGTSGSSTMIETA
eukprot:COSAG01_NODE_19_length_39011_cov_38.134968_15_plen_386_part_00